MAFKSVWGFNPEELLRAHSMSFLLGTRVTNAKRPGAPFRDNRTRRSRRRRSCARQRRRVLKTINSQALHLCD